MVNELRLVARTRLTHVHAHVFSSLIPLSYLSSLYSFCSTIWEFKIECIYDLCSDSCFRLGDKLGDKVSPNMQSERYYQ